MRYLILCIYLFITIFLDASPFDGTKDLPVAFQGRFRSLDPAARLWLYDFYHVQHLKKDQLISFKTNDPSALELLWRLHFMGHALIDNAPLFWIHYAVVKDLLGLDIKESRFSYNELNQALSKVNLSHVDPSYIDDVNQLSQSIKNFYAIDNRVTQSNSLLAALIKQKQASGIDKRAISDAIENKFPLSSRLRHAGTTLKMLPSKKHEGEWLSLHALHIKSYDPVSGELAPIGNFTSFSDVHFQGIQVAYDDLSSLATRYFTNDNSLNAEEFQLAINRFANKILTAYQSLEGTAYIEAMGKSLYYPTLNQLKAESLYYQLPLIEISILGYGLALILFLIAFTTKNKNITTFGFIALILAFILHTLVLILRCYILQRPPVSNMFETVVYVPWIAILVGIIMNRISRNEWLLIASSLAALALLILLKLTDVDARLENVQAVLDSQYWLIVHVLMVVGSYGIFIVCGMLGHLYLLICCLNKTESSLTQFMAKCILHTMYIGVALLIPGTILGGVWAAQSWGRFWDWDPKESWAFISACVYVIIIHAYTFRKIYDLGLAIGSIIGLMAISFTWYGVNYILGTGLHSYGFGRGGEIYYFGYLLGETLFLGITTGIYLFFKSPKKYS